MKSFFWLLAEGGTVLVALDCVGVIFRFLKTDWSTAEMPGRLAHIMAVLISTTLQAVSSGFLMPWSNAESLVYSIDLARRTRVMARLRVPSR